VPRRRDSIARVVTAIEVVMFEVDS
jgi:hypothetical protein